MKCLIDTNVLVSAALFPKSVPAQAFFKAVTPPCRAIVCDYSMDELRRVFNAKFPHRIQCYERFVSMMALSVEIVPAPMETESVEEESKIRDVNDRAILRAAIASKADILITGDKDFLEAGIIGPNIVNAAEFLEMRR